MVATNISFSGGVAYNTTTQKFGRGSLNGGYGTVAGALPASAVVTMEGWGKITSPGSIQLILGQSGYAWMGIAANGTAVASYGNVTISTVVAIGDAVWHHLALCVGADGGYLYVDGTLAGSNAKSASAAGVGSSGSPTLGIRAFADSSFGWVGDVDELAIWGVRQYNSNFTPAAAPYTGREANLLHLYHVDGNGVDSVGATVYDGIVFSPGNWALLGGSAKSINAGAYFYTLFKGQTCILNFDTTNNGTPLSQNYYRIDGYEAGLPWTKANVASTITITMPTATSAAPYHYLEVAIKSTSTTLNRWSATSATAVAFTGLTLDFGATAVLPGSPAKKILIFGDSITESLFSVNSTAADTDQHDGMMGWAYKLRELLGVEAGVIGFGSTGLMVAGFTVPPLPSSYNLVYTGQLRVPDTSTALIVINIGTNDSGFTDAAVTAALITVLNGMLSAYPTTPIAVLRPFNGTKASALQAGVAGCSSPGRVTYVDTTGVLNPAYGVDPNSGLHPLGANNLAMIAPAVANKLQPLLAGAASGAKVVPLPRLRALRLG